jgi:hypothetical protein
MQTWLGIVAAVGALMTTACGGSKESSDAASAGAGRSGGGGPCGGKQGGTCASDEYCDFSADTCGADDGGGVCKPRPQGCSDIYQPACGCDGHVYGNICEANTAGADVGAVGCTPPKGTFGCGAEFCGLGTEFCLTDPEPPPNDSATCKPLPAACGSSPSCACLENIACGNCMPTSDGGLMVSCAAG